MIASHEERSHRKLWTILSIPETNRTAERALAMLHVNTRGCFKSDRSGCQGRRAPRCLEIGVLLSSDRKTYIRLEQPNTPEMEEGALLPRLGLGLFSGPFSHAGLSGVILRLLHSPALGCAGFYSSRLFDTLYTSFPAGPHDPFWRRPLRGCTDDECPIRY